MTEIEALQAQFGWLSDLLDEQARRIWAAAEARAIGWGGVSLVAKATGLSRVTIHAGLKDLAEGRPQSSKPQLRGR